MSHREYLTRLAWLQGQWNEPDRTDYYLMRVAQRVQQLMHVTAMLKEPVDLEEQRVKFEIRQPAPPMSKEQATAWAKARWGGILGVNLNG